MKFKRKEMKLKKKCKDNKIFNKHKKNLKVILLMAIMNLRFTMKCMINFKVWLKLHYLLIGFQKTSLKE